MFSGKVDHLRDILTAVRAQGDLEASLNVTGSGPFEGGYTTIPLEIARRPAAQSGAPSPEIGLQRISDGFFEMLHVPLRAGRYFTAQDTDGSLPVAVVNDEAVRRFWNGRIDPLVALRSE